MKLRKILLSLLATMALGTAGAQNFQPLNNHFSQWDSESATAEPSHWNSFATSTGSYASLASSPHHYHRHNAQGDYLTIYTKSILGIKANGNMTTGRINAGSMTPSSPSNYNFTQRDNADFSQAFTATPDSMRLRVSYYAKNESSRGGVTVYIHGDSDFQDPNHSSDPSLYAAKAIAQFARTTESATSYSWQTITVPFEYCGSAQPAYLLISLTTNTVQGGGDGNDSLSIQAIDFIYSSWLSRISVNGTPLEEFSKTTFSYNLGMADEENGFLLEATPEVEDATVAIDSLRSMSISENGDSLYRIDYTILVTAEDGSTRTYTVTRQVNHPIQVGMEGVTAPEVRIYPNPSCGMFHIEAQEGTLIGLFNAMGAQMGSTVVLKGENTFSTEGFAPGIYFVRVNSAKGTSTHKLLVR